MRTYRGRTEEEQRAFNEERREKARKAREAKNNTLTVSAEDFPDLSELEAHINVEKVEIPQLSLKDRILSRFKRDEDDDDKKKAPPSKIEKEHTEKSEKLLSHILPVTCAALIALYAEKLFSEEYKACAPSKEEIATIMLPFFSIISRHVGIEGKASQDAIDMGAIVLASVTIGTRMLMTAEQIRRSNNAANNATGRDHQTTDSRMIRYREKQNGNDQYAEPYGSHDGGARNESLAGQYEGRGSDDARQVAELLRKDTEGRRAMGLAPRAIQQSS